MRAHFPLLAALSVLISSSAFAAPDRVVLPKGTAKPNRLFCKTGSENRPSQQSLELFFQYHLPVVFEPEDPTVPFGRQVMVLQGRPLVELRFKKSAEPAGESGEKLEPMTCAFARRVVAANEPSHLQIFLPAGQTHWLSQSLGQRTGPKQLSFDRAVFAPAGDWSFASQFEKVFSVEVEDLKSFVTTQLPKAI